MSNEHTSTVDPALVGEAALIRELGLTKYKLRSICGQVGVEPVRLSDLPRARRHYRQIDIAAIRDFLTQPAA